jgi:hypothetical protein
VVRHVQAGLPAQVKTHRCCGGGHSFAQSVATLERSWRLIQLSLHRWLSRHFSIAAMPSDAGFQSMPIIEDVSDAIATEFREYLPCSRLRNPF